MSEFESNNNKANSEFKISDEVNESKIGKAEINESPNPEDLAKFNAGRIEKMQGRLAEKKAGLAKMEEKMPSVKDMERNLSEATQKEEQLKKLIKEQLSSDNPNDQTKIEQQQQLQEEITALRTSGNETRNQIFQELPSGQRSVLELNEKIGWLKDEIAQEEDILEANIAELK